MDNNMLDIMQAAIAKAKEELSMATHLEECGSNAGIRKMNIGTDVCCAFAEGTKKTLEDPNRSLAVDLFMKVPIESVKALAIEKIRLVEANGKA